MNVPLAQRLRPTSLEEVCGQHHLLGPQGVLRRFVESGRLTNMIFYGPSGTGKTTVAEILAKNAGMTFRKLNGTTASSADIKAVLEETQGLLGAGGVLLYLDELQYLNRKQQQVLLEYIEDGRVTLIASTTENPYFYIYKAVLSRCAVFEFKSLDTPDVLRALERAKRHLDAEAGREKPVEPKALELLALACGGDLRRAVNSLELCYFAAGDTLTLEDAQRLGNRSLKSYDSEGDDKFELMSALQKSIRGSDADAALFYLARLLDAGDLISPCRRLLVIASEDVGLAYPQAAAITKACVDSAQQLGLPEAAIPLAQAVVMLATAPKSNSAYLAVDAATADIERGLGVDLPKHLRSPLFDGYRYPHDYTYHYVKQQYLPDDLAGKKYYTFGDNKTEQTAAAYAATIRREGGKKKN